MTKVTLEIEGMACSMCESHINEAVRKAFDVKKVSASHSKNQTVILTDLIYENGVLLSQSERFSQSRRSMNRRCGR